MLVVESQKDRGGGGSYSQKNWVEIWRSTSQNPYPKVNVSRALVDDVIDNDEKVLVVF